MTRMRVCAVRERFCRVLDVFGRFGLMGVFAMLTACSVLPKPEPQQVYTLPEPGPAVHRLPSASLSGSAAGKAKSDQAAEPGTTQRWSLRVLTPYSNRMIDGARILVQPDHGEVNVYKGVRWSDPPPQMLRDRLVDAFRSSGRIGAVSNDSVHLASDLELGGDLNSFQVEYVNGVPTVHIQLDAFLVEPASSKVVATQRFSVKQAVDGKEVPEVVLAFGKAVDELSMDIVTWAVKHGPAPVKGR